MQIKWNKFNNLKIKLDAINSSKMFLLFSLLNCFCPIFLCMISSLLPYYGAQAVMGVGYASTFLLSFAQLGITFSISLFFYFRNSKKNAFNQENSQWLKYLLISFVIGLICLTIYILSCYLYFNFSNKRPNTIDSLKYGMNFVYSSIGFVLLSSMEGYLLLNLKNKNQILAISLFCSRTCLSLVLSLILLKYTNLNTIGIGLSFSLIMILFILIDYYLVWKYQNFKIFKKIAKLNKNKANLRNVFQESISPIALSLAKGICIMILGFIMYEKLTDFVSISYQMSRVVWFNIMYMIPWFGIGISDAIKFNDLYVNVEQNKNQLVKQYWILLLITLIISLLMCVAGYFLVNPLTHLYIKNTSLLYGSVPSLGTSLKLETLPPTYLPEIKPGQDIISYITDTLIKDNQWREWLDKNKIDILHNAFHFQEFKTWFLNYISATSYDPNIIYALIMYKNPEQLEIISSPLLLKFKMENFNSKTFFYILIYGTLSSGWSVLLPSIATISKKQMPPWLLIIIYFLCVGFIISFGATFSISPIADQLANNNPFKYLDAWTFPIAIISVIIFSYLFIKWIFVSKKYLSSKEYIVKVK